MYAYLIRPSRARGCRNETLIRERCEMLELGERGDKRLSNTAEFVCGSLTRCAWGICDLQAAGKVFALWNANHAGEVKLLHCSRFKLFA